VALALRIVAFVFALIWAIPLFAIVDLSTALTWREGWAETLALEASWGALFTFFMVLPLLALVFRPTRSIEVGLWSGVVAVSLVIGAVLFGDPVILLLAGFAVITGAIVVGLGVAARRADPTPPVRPHLRPSWLLLALALAGIPLWGTYVVHSTEPPGGVPSSVTIAFDHWPVQVGLGVAIMIASVLVALVVELRTIGLWACAFSAAVVGVIMALSQGLPVATESPVWCIVAVLWGTAMGLALHAAPYTGLAPAEAQGGVDTANDAEPPAATSAAASAD
jgi:hypothetical protein